MAAGAKDALRIAWSVHQRALRNTLEDYHEDISSIAFQRGNSERGSESRDGHGPGRWLQRWVQRRRRPSPPRPRRVQRRRRLLSPPWWWRVQRRWRLLPPRPIGRAHV